MQKLGSQTAFKPCILPKCQTKLTILTVVFCNIKMPLCFKYTKRLATKEMKESVLASNICRSNPKLTIFAKKSPPNRSFYQILHQMHSCHTTILLQNVYFTTSNNFITNSSVTRVSVYRTRRMGKNVNFGQTPIHRMLKRTSFGSDIFAYLKHIGI